MSMLISNYVLKLELIFMLIETNLMKFKSFKSFYNLIKVKYILLSSIDKLFWLKVVILFVTFFSDLAI